MGGRKGGKGGEEGRKRGDFFKAYFIVFLKGKKKLFPSPHNTADN